MRANPNYYSFASHKMIISKLTLVEFYSYLLREEGKEKADFFFGKLLLNCEDIPDEVLKQGVSFRQRLNAELKRRKKPLSYIDAITYAFAAHLKVKFLTGDETFKDLPNVEFVK